MFTTIVPRIVQVCPPFKAILLTSSPAEWYVREEDHVEEDCPVVPLPHSMWGRRRPHPHISTSVVTTSLKMAPSPLRLCERHP